MIMQNQKSEHMIIDENIHDSRIDLLIAMT